MRTTGIVRRIDELGRIVIPKEVRKRLKMDSGDTVDIAVEDEKVVLTKFHPLNHDSQLVKNFCDSLKEIYNCDIFITDINKVVYNTIDPDYIDMPLDQEFLKRVNSYLDKELSALNKICLTSNYCFDKDAIIYEINLNESLYGYLVIVDVMISKKNKDVAQLVLSYLSKIL